MVLSALDVVEPMTAPTAETVETGDPSVAMVGSAIANTKLWDAFIFRDRVGRVVRVERVSLAHYGTHWRIYHEDKTYILPYGLDTDTRLHAISLVRQYVQKHAIWWTLALLPGQALNHWHRRASKQRVVRIAW